MHRVIWKTMAFRWEQRAEFLGFLWRKQKTKPEKTRHEGADAGI